MCAVLLIAGCVRTTQPVLNDDQLQTDDSTVGRWVSQPGTELLDVRKADGKYEATYVDKDGKEAMLDVRYGKIGKLNVAELSAHDPAGDRNDVYKAHLLPLYSFLVVDATKPQLVFRSLSSKWLKEYVTAHPTELAVINANTDNPIVTASTADFQAFLLKHWGDADAVSGDPMIFVRPGDPTTKPAAQ
jgi:hypothetical protein